MNAGEDFNGREIDAPTSFFLGVAVNPAADDLPYELERFEQKLEAGAKFAMTQVLFDFAYLDDFIARLGRPCPIPLLIGIFYVKSYQLALRLHNEVPGIVVPDHVQARLARRRTERRGGGAWRSHASCSRSHASGPPASTSSRPSGNRWPRSSCSRSGEALPRAVGRETSPYCAASRASASRTRSGGTPKPPRSPGLRAKIVVRTRPWPSTARPSRVPRPDDAPDRRHRLPHRPAPVGVPAQEVPGLAEASRASA